MKVFISYSSLDRSEAFELLSLLENEGCDVWLDFFDIKPTETLEKELSGNLEKAELVCVLLSPNSVTSSWVILEARLALEKRSGGLRVLPILLRPCKIPDLLADLVGVDARDGFANEAVALRIVRAVLGTERVEEAMVLSAAQRSELAKRAMQDEADRWLPNLDRDLDRIRQKSIRELSVSIDEKSIPKEKPTILELKLTLNPLWTQPMSFYFAQFREGATWPDEFAFEEPPYTHYFKASYPRVDCQFRWFDRVEKLVQTMDGTDFKVLPATFNLQFDGTEFHPSGPQPHLPQKFEIPSLQVLQDHGSQFQLIAHYPTIRSAEYIDLAATDIDINVSAHFQDSQPGSCRLFRSRHRQDEQVVLGCKSALAIESLIAREAVLSSYSMPSEEKEPERKRRLIEGIDANEPIAEADRRLAAIYCFGEAQLACVRGDDLKALKKFQQSAELLQPIVLESYPTYEEGILMYRACENLVGYFLQKRKYRRAADFVNGVGVVAQRLTDLDPSEPDYWRLWADALHTNAIVHAENGENSMAVKKLRESTETWFRLHTELPSHERWTDARKAFATALELATRWEITSQLPLEEWRQKMDPNGAIGVAVQDKARKAAGGPVWLRPADPEDWPTEQFKSALLRYSLRIPKRWSGTPKLNALPKEIEHVFRGPWPTEWLIVSFMENAGGQITDWVDALLAVSGFPVLAMTGSSGPQPSLLEWQYEGALDVIARKLKVDEAHGYTGIAQLPGKRPRLARLYILLARRDVFSWKFTLAFETACLPGMPAEVVAPNDHVRAGAILGELSLG